MADADGRGPAEQRRPAERRPPAPSEDRRDLRRHGRIRISWPVKVKSTTGEFEMQTVDVSPVGAKIRPKEALEAGTMALLQFHPPDGPALDVRAMVWRSDPDGLAFFFMGGRVADLLSSVEAS